MNKVKESMIIKLTDTFDEAAMLYYHATIDEEIDNTAVTNYDKEKGRLNYYECLCTVIDYFLGIKNIDDSHLDDETKNKIIDLFDDLDDEIEENSLNSEEGKKFAKKKAKTISHILRHEGKMSKSKMPSVPQVRSKRNRNMR